MSTVPRPSVQDVSVEDFALKAAAARRAALVWRRASVAQRVAALRGVWRELAARRAEVVVVVREE
ncbi:MAG: hypothetical protein AAB262_10285, partial [Elusimicrobiota bacterium]